MSQWYIPQEMQVPVSRRTATNAKKGSLLLNVFLPFVFAVMGIPVYIMIVLKLLNMVL